MKQFRHLPFGYQMQTNDVNSDAIWCLSRGLAKVVFKVIIS